MNKLDAKKLAEAIMDKAERDRGLVKSTLVELIEDHVRMGMAHSCSGEVVRYPNGVDSYCPGKLFLL
jgi:hypothetical protein